MENCTIIYVIKQANLFNNLALQYYYNGENEPVYILAFIISRLVRHTM